jgi:hypothetical protein
MSSAMTGFRLDGSSPAGSGASADAPDDSELVGLPGELSTRRVLRRLVELAGVWLEVLSALSYVVIFRSVFCQRMRWGLSYQFGMAEQGANSVLSVSGTGGLALGAWALRRGGMSTEHIARRTGAFFF